MDGRGRGKDKVITGRLWGSLKYEEVIYPPVKPALSRGRAWEMEIRFYNPERPHCGQNGSTTEEVYRTRFPLVA